MPADPPAARVQKALGGLSRMQSWNVNPGFVDAPTRSGTPPAAASPPARRETPHGVRLMLMLMRVRVRVRVRVRAQRSSARTGTLQLPSITRRTTA